MRSVIATQPDNNFSLGRDLNLIKTCALYSDSVVLISPTYEGMEPLIDFAARPLFHQLIYMAVLYRDPGFTVGEQLTEIERSERIKRAKERSVEFIEKARRVLSQVSDDGTFAMTEVELSELTQEIRPYVEAISTTFTDTDEMVKRARQITAAREMGLVTVHQIHEAPSIYYSPDKLIQDLTQELANPESYGALDERFLPSEIGKHPSSRSRKQSVAQVAVEMFSRLPGFSTATVDEIRDIKTELAPHTARFRSALISISKEIESAEWDEGFSHEVEQELRIHLYPSISEIEDQVSSNSFLREFVTNAIRRPLVLPASSGIGLLLSSAGQTSSLVGQILAAATGAGFLAADAWKTWKANQKEATENRFFFYYQLSKLISK